MQDSNTNMIASTIPAAAPADKPPEAFGGFLGSEFVSELEDGPLLDFVTEVDNELLVCVPAKAGDEAFLGPAMVTTYSIVSARYRNPMFHIFPTERTNLAGNHAKV